jgi:hypothetical protein
MYANTPMSDILREDHPFSVKAFVGHAIEDCAPALVRLADTWNDESTTPFAAAHNLPSTRDAVWQYYTNSPKQGTQFNRAMTGLDAMSLAALVQDVQWADYCTTILDIGGGRGSLLAAILEAAPSITGVLMDLPPVINQSRQLWAERHPQLADRVSFVGGSFFDADAVPRTEGLGCFCYLSKVPLAITPTCLAISPPTHRRGTPRPCSRFPHSILTRSHALRNLSSRIP